MPKFFQNVNLLLELLPSKKPVKVASTENIDLEATISSIDSVVLTDKSRVLLKDQTETAENGIYELRNDLLVRTRDANTSVKLFSGCFTNVQKGTVNADTLWMVTSDDIELEEDPVIWTEIAMGGGGGGGGSSNITYKDTRTDSTEQVWTIDREPVSMDYIEVYKNGVLMHVGVDNDFTMSGKVITFANPIVEEDIVCAVYEA